MADLRVYSGYNSPDGTTPSISSFHERHIRRMTTIAEGATVSPIAVSALVVERTLPDALLIVSILTDCRFHVTTAETFAKARACLISKPPTVLVTELRLGEYNGLQLVLQGKSVRTDMAAIVISSVPDPVLQADAEAMGATFVLKPVADKEFSAAVFRTIFQKPSLTDAASRIRPPFERRSGERRAVARPTEHDRRTSERRRDLPSLLALAARPV